MTWSGISFLSGGLDSWGAEHFPLSRGLEIGSCCQRMDGLASRVGWTLFQPGFCGHLPWSDRSARLIRHYKDQQLTDPWGPVVCGHSAPGSVIHSFITCLLLQALHAVMTAGMLWQVVAVSEEKRGHVTQHYYLLTTTPCTIDGIEDDIEDSGIKSFIKAGQMIPIDNFSQTHGPFCRLFGMSVWFVLFFMSVLQVCLIL